MSGKFLSQLYICLREKDGIFGPIVSRNLEKPANMHIDCTKSGKMTTLKMKGFVWDVLQYTLPKKACLVLDAWSGQKDESVFATSENRFKIMYLPEGSTKFLQSLDVGFNRCVKDVIRCITERILPEQLDIEIHQRNVIVRMNSLIHNQFSFLPIICWHLGKCRF